MEKVSLIKCDDYIQKQAKVGEISGWKDFTEFLNPNLFLKHIMSVLNSMQNGNGFENQEAFEDYKKLLINTYPYVTREMEEKEIREAILFDAMPF